MAETIVLPRSGVTLTTFAGSDYRAIVGGLYVRIFLNYYRRWEASTLGGGYAGCETFEIAVASLDNDLVTLRAALLPPGSAVVSDTPETRNTVRRALREAERQRGMDCCCGDQGPGPCGACVGADDAASVAVLRALGVAPGEGGR